MNYNPDNLWLAPLSKDLVVVCPGTTGLGFPTKRGFGFIAAELWAAGISVYFANTSGQDGRVGELDMAAWLQETFRSVNELLVEGNFERISFFGACLGGPVVAACASQLRAVHWVFLWETAPRYTEAHRQDFLVYCKEFSIRLAPSFWKTLLELDHYAEQDWRCVLYHGTEFAIPFVKDDLNKAKANWPTWDFIEISGASHGFPRGSSPSSLRMLSDNMIARIKGRN